MAKPPATPGKPESKRRKAPNETRVWQLAEPEEARRRIAAAGQSGLLLEGQSERELTLLDSLDWRLYDAGLLLLAEGTGEAASLALLALDGTRAPRHLPFVATRFFPWELPSGAFAKRLTSVLGPRRALPRGKLRIASQGFRLLGGERRLVAVLSAERAEIDRLSPIDSASVESFDLPDRLSLEFAPEDGAQLQRLIDALGLGEAPQANGGLLLEAASRLRAATALPKRPKLTAREEAAEPALCRLLAVEGRILEALRPGVLADLDSECLHDLRTTTRRARSLLRCFGKALPAARRRRLESRLTWLGRTTGEARDLDVLWLYLAGIDEGVAPPPPELIQDLKPTLARVEARRHRVLSNLTEQLTRPRFSKLIADLQAAPADPSGSKAGVHLGKLAERRIGKALSRVLSEGAAIDDNSPGEALHDLRKSVKKLRYSLDAGVALLPSVKAGGKMIGRLKELQTLLGLFQDCEVFAQALDRLAKQEAPMGQGCLIALGRLIERLELERRTARAGFERSYRRFSRGAKRWAADTKLDVG